MPGRKRRFLAPELLSQAALHVAREAGGQDIRVALIGGFAMQYYGSPRLTGDIDLVSSGRVARGGLLRHQKPLAIGGDRFLVLDGVPVDIVFRQDEYAALYREAVENSVETPDGFFVVRPEYLAAMKFAARRAKDEIDLLWLLSQPGLVDVEKARSIVREHVGGRFGVDEFNSVLREAQWRKGEFVEEDEGDR